VARSDNLDEVDLKILHALQLDGRLPFSSIARVLGVSDQTVARRYAQLRSMKKVRVLGRTDPLRVGETSWFVRVRCSPNAVASLGEALARRPETSWVKLTSGGTELVAVVRAAVHHDSPSLLLEQLPRTSSVVDVTANCMLHMFFGGAQGVVDALSDDQIAALRPPTAQATSRVELDDVDRRLLTLLEADGRADVEALAKDSGVPATTVRRHIAELRESGALYFDVDVDYGRLALYSQTILWLTINPKELRRAGEMLAAHPEVAFAAATTGATNLYANVLCADASAFFEYLTTRVAALPALQTVESAPVIRTLKGL
jgi:DNA-binding Lrp family transcriptional regulator